MTLLVQIFKNRRHLHFLFILFWLVFILPVPALAQFAGGLGNEEDPYQVETLEQLQLIADSSYLDKHFVQIADIDASDTEHWNDGKGFEPIGKRSHSFTGSYDGNAHTISELHINRSDEDNVGLIGYADGVDISRVGMIGSYVRGRWQVGTLIGRNENGSITDSYSEGDVTAEDGSVGGLVGSNIIGSITGSYAKGNVTGSDDSVLGRIGGLVGYNEKSTITNSYAKGNVTGSSHVGGLIGFNLSGNITKSYVEGEVIGSSSVGGLVGYNTYPIVGPASDGQVKNELYFVGELVGWYESFIIDSFAKGNVTGGGNQVGGLLGFNTFIISNSYAEGDVTGEGNRVGGLVGDNSGPITGSYAKGNVTGVVSVGGLVGNNIVSITDSYAKGDVTGGNQVGGFVGRNSFIGHISQSYSLGKTSGDDDVGGFAGLNEATIEKSYWDTEYSERTNAVGRGPAGDVTGLTTDQMTGQNAYINMYELDFNETWQLTEGYPALAWQQHGNAVEQPEVPIVRVAPKEEEYDYGEVETDSSATRSYTLRNTGNIAMSGEVSLTGTHNGAFEIIRGEGDYTLEPDSSRVIEVEFRPATADTFQATLEIHHDAPNRDDPLTISLKGTGKLSMSTGSERQLPRQPELHQNHPNPFNPVTVIAYSLPQSETVTLSIYDVMGRRVKTLINQQHMPAGRHQAVWDASNIASGTYLYRLQAGDFIQSRSMLLVK